MIVNWSQLSALATQYWSVPIGMAIVYFFGKYHFNTPDYALIRDTISDTTTAIEPKNSAAARLHTTAPPVFTTLRERYRKAEIKYILVLLTAFFCITIFPNILTLIPNLQGATQFVSESLEQRVIIAALVLTGFLSSFPFIRDFDGWLLKALHSEASIPDDAEQTADELFEAGYRRDPATATDLMARVRSPHLRAVADGTIFGLLEVTWLNLRCLAERLKDTLQEPRYKDFKRKFRFEFEDIYRNIERYRSEIVSLLDMQIDKVPSDSIRDIDDRLEQHSSSDTSLKNLLEKRVKLLFELNSLRYRTCLFTSVLVYATERDQENINKRLNLFGFPVKIIKPVTRIRDIVLLSVFSTFMICLMTSLFYTLIVQGLQIQIPDSYKDDVPNGLKEAGFWALITAALHGIACFVSSVITVSKIKASTTQGLANVMDLSYTTLIAGVACVIPGLMLGLVAIGMNIDIANALPWIVLPFITAFCSSNYIGMAASGIRVRAAFPEIQAAIMVGCTVLLAIVLNTQGPLPTWPTVFWVFLIYAALTTGLIGLALGEIFCRGLKARSEPTPIGHTTPSGLAFVTEEVDSTG
jgi:hypothetical protein